ncbi:RNA pseudouridine synthase, partial [bacterium]|nr:RNA pseudouridine synthase [bacterium]
IRVHLSEKGCPVAGDRKYGEKEKGTQRLALHAASITFLHPATKKEMTFETPIPDYFLTLVKR